VIGLQAQRRTEGVQPFEVRIDDIDEDTIVISRAGPGSGISDAAATVATIRDGKVTRLRQYPTRAAALAAAP
jgi:ketosteroid isomerase-like protein